jgi:hypothetical protein
LYISTINLIIKQAALDTAALQGDAWKLVAVVYQKPGQSLFEFQLELAAIFALEVDLVVAGDVGPEFMTAGRAGKRAVSGR